MKMNVLLCCFLLVLPIWALHLDRAEIKGRIIGGTVARFFMFPWQAGISIHARNGEYFCGGALINDQWILTAAQCVSQFDKFSIQLGSNSRISFDPNRQLFSTSTFLAHPKYNATTLENDIALIKLHMPVLFSEYIKKIDVAGEGDGIGADQKVTVAGWGGVSDGMDLPVNNLVYVELITESNLECRLTYGDQIKDSMICAAGNNNEGICIGDTGGPLVRLGNITTNPLLIGVASFMSQNGCEAPDPTGFTRADIYYQWITETISRN